jgi:hypothetical protein
MSPAAGGTGKEGWAMFFKLSPGAFTFLIVAGGAILAAICLSYSYGVLFR